MNDKTNELIQEINDLIIEKETIKIENKNRINNVKLWNKYKRENPYIYRKLNEFKIKQIIEHLYKYGIDYKIKTYYYDKDDYLEFWCSQQRLSEAKANKTLNKDDGKFLIFDDGSIVEFNIK